MADKRVKIIKHNNVSVKFEVDSRYSPLESIGTGAYGVVCAAKDNRTGRRVAIKKIPKVFDMIQIAKRTYRELKILRHLRHENIISILDVMQPPEDISTFQDVYVVLDLMESDLHHIIHSVQPLSDEHITFFLYQIVRGLKYIHSASVLHRDLKPSNLLINRNCELKIGDFGMARGLSSSPEDRSSFMTEYVATRWYRAPELMLSLNEYTFAIDMWSVGCILAEMLARRQLFPGKNYLHQLQLILSVVGTPNEEYVNCIGSERVKTYLQTLPPRKAVELSVLFPKATPNALELLGQLLQLDPKKRLSAEETLAHEYLSSYHDPKDEPVCTPPFDFSFEKDLFTKEDLCRGIVDEISDYHKCRLPIPTQDKVKVAIMKLMEDREKEKERQAQDEGTAPGGGPSGAKEAKEGPSKRKKGEDKKRKQHHHPHDTGAPDKKKRPKLEGHPPPPPPPAGEHSVSEGGVSESDQHTLDRWKQMQQTTRPFIHPIRKMLGKDGEAEGNGSLTYQEQLLSRQSDQIEQQKHQLEEQQKKIRDQEELIRLLQEQRRVLLQECQSAGIKIPESIQIGIYSSTANLNATLPPSSQPLAYASAIPLSQQPLSQPPVSPAQPLNQTSPYVNVSPTLHPPSHAHQSELHPSIPRTTPPQNLSRISHSIHPSSTQFVPAPQMQSHTVSRGININQTSQLLPTGTLYPPGEAAIRTSPLMGTFNFPALTNEFQDLPPDESHGLLHRPYSPPPLNTFDSFPDDLDSILNIAGLPTGSGAGYGVGVMEEELPGPTSNPQLDLSDLGPRTSMGPPSASLLRDWLDVRQLDPDDMHALQQELETGTPDMFMQALDDL